MRSAGTLTRARRAVVGVALAGLLTGGLTAAASATVQPLTEPAQLGADYVTDLAGVLSADDAERANQRLDETYRETGIDLFVVFVDDFTNPADSNDWTNDTADLNGLGASQYLLGVATEGRQYYISGLDGGELSSEFLAHIEEQIRPDLRDDDWLGAIETAADTIEQGTTDGGSGDGFASVLRGMGWFFVVLLVVAALAVIVVVVMRRRKKGAQRQLQSQNLAQLSRTAGSALVNADDALKTSADELEFARAQFGDESVKEFAAALTAAKKNVDQAFALKQKLDDEIPDTDEQKRAWYTQIVELCRAAEEGLDEKADAFDELRKLEQNAPAALAAVDALRQRLRGIDDFAKRQLQELQGTYAADELAVVVENPVQITARLSFADGEIGEARATIESGTALGAAVSIRAAEQALAQAEALWQALAAHGRELQAAAERGRALISELHKDIATARSLPDPQNGVAAAIQSTEQRISEAQAMLDGAQRRPIQAQRALEEANTHIDGVVEQASAFARAQQLLDAQLAQVRDQVLQADNFIASRRGAIGVTARTRISEAHQALARAEALREQHDAAGANKEIQRVTQLVSAALQAAQNDARAYTYPQDGGGFGGYGNGYGGTGGVPGGISGGSASSGSDLLAAVLGGILIGGGGGSGRSRGPRITGGGGSGGGRSKSGGFSAGSFGGSRTRSRRGGGRF